jgi:hypothetical protein
MKISIKLLIIFFICMIGSIIVWGAVQGKEQKPAISVGERAQAIWEVQNVMSKHAYYKQINQHCEEMADIWVKENGPNDKTATWTSQYGVEVGIAQIKLNYCTACIDDMKKKLEEISKIYPAIENKPENIGTGYMYFMHTNLLPVIEIAGDGKTAKGLWYSIGLNVRPAIAADGKATISTHWAPEKYAVDFIKENGKWKIWHFVNIFEPSSSEMMQAFNQEEQAEQDQKKKQGDSQQSTADMKQGSFKMPEIKMKPVGQRGVLPGGDTSEVMGIVHYITRIATDFHVWTPTSAPKIYPKFPEPYYTFSETFSY